MVLISWGRVVLLSVEWVTSQKLPSKNLRLSFLREPHFFFNSRKETMLSGGH